jgi:hypothetical protein
MKTFKTLLLREWMQHRFGWALLVLVPVVLALATLALAPNVNVQFEDDSVPMGDMFAAFLAVIAMSSTTAILFMILAGTSLFLVAGLARRDHGDRSYEFWLSLPTSHTQSLAAPLLTHLVLVPIAALALGAVLGAVVSAALVGRVLSLGEWFALPWGQMAAAAAALFVRFAIGVPLAVLWLSPLILAAVLAGAVLKRWGLPVLVVGLALVISGARELLGIVWPARAIELLFVRAGQSLIDTTHSGYSFNSAEQFQTGLSQVPAGALGDIGPAVGLLVSPAFIAVAAVSAALFVLLLEWRKRGSSIGV